MKFNRTLVQTIITLILLFGITTLIFLYTSGYRFEKGKENPVDLTKTGMISAKSIPEGASVYLDGELLTATNDTISGIEPGSHNLRIVKKGFEQWNKHIEVFEELVTDITAVLVSQSPVIEPLTNTGASNPSISPSLNNLTYFSKDEESPGVWVIPINQTGLNLFRATPYVVLEDTKVNRYSDGKSILWSPDEDQLLVETNDGIYYIVNLETNTAQTASNYEVIIENWENKLRTKRELFVSKLDIPEHIMSLATTSDVLWSPDEKKFLYTVQNNDILQYKVYNMEKPLPVGEKVETTVFEINVNEEPPEITWYADSFHLILTEGEIQQNKRGTISLVRIDGTNKVEIYGEALYSPNVYSAPGGDKIIILASFKSSDQPDLYTVGIR
jgi:WD40 repeat protein